MSSLNNKHGKKNKRIAKSFVILLGIFGIHNFYLYQIRKGIIQLCLVLSSTVCIFLAFFLGYGEAQSTANANLAEFAIFMLFIGFFLIIIATIWWIVDIVNIFKRNARD